MLSAAEMVGTVAFALSGALLAIEKRLDIFGIMVLGVVTSLGGGTIRDVLLGNTPPRMFYSVQYVFMSCLAAVLMFVIVKWSKGKLLKFTGTIDVLFTVCDALGLGIFSVVGTQAGIMAGYGDNMFLCVFLGMTTGVGGGILRDMMCGDIPVVLRKHVYAVAAIVGSITFYVLIYVGLDGTLASLAGMAVTVVLRLLAWHFRWNLPRIQSI